MVSMKTQYVAELWYTPVRLRGETTRIPTSSLTEAVGAIASKLRTPVERLHTTQRNDREWSVWTTATNQLVGRVEIEGAP